LLQRPEQAHSDKLKGIAFIFVAYFLYAIGDAGAKWLVVDLSVWQVLFVRSTVGVMVCITVVGWSNVKQMLRLPWQWEIVVMNLANFSGWAAYYSAARDLPLTQLYCMYYLSPIITILLGGAFLHERVTGWHWLAAAIGFGGALIVTNPSSDLPKLLPALLGFSTALFWAIAGVLYRRNVANNDNWVLINSFNMVMAVMCTLPMTQAWLPVYSHHLPALAIVSIAAIAAHYFYLNGIRLVPVAVAGPISFSSLLWSIALGYLIFSDLPDLRVLLGAALIVLSGLIVIFTLNESRTESSLNSHVEDMTK